MQLQVPQISQILSCYWNIIVGYNHLIFLRNTQCSICVFLYVLRNELACVILHAHSQGVFTMLAASDRLQSISSVHS